MHAFDSTDDHQLYEAYALLFGNKPKRALVLDEASLSAAFSAKVRETHPERAKQLGRTRLELSQNFEGVEKAYRFLLEVLGEQSSVMITEPISDLIPDSETPPPFLPPDRVAKIRAATIAAGTGLLDTPAPMTVESLMPPVIQANRVKLGRFLLSKGRITLQQLIDAVLWQRAQRPAVGKIALSWKVLERKQVYEVLMEKRHDQLFCSVAVDKGYMTPFQRLAILGKQRQLQQPIGRYFVEKGILSEGDIDRAVDEQRRLDP
ncbi:MAG: hypothetical protein IPG45_19025 [Deltaproteobacteria bacterium]|nr:hypothetical protein [Deltaproteobacteria bacterium]